MPTPRLRAALQAIAATALLALPAALHAQDWAKTRLESSPRHHEYVTVPSGGRSVQVFVVYPEVETKAPVVVLIHEIFGLSDWAREMADELAAQGYIVVEPDLLSGAGPGGGGSSSFASQDDTVKAVSMLDPAQVTADLNAAADYAEKLPSTNGHLAVAGFCWGGGKSFLFATQRADLRDAFVFYGPPPTDAALAGIHAPVFGFYAGNDARIAATVPATTTAMKAAHKHYQPTLYDGAGHGFMRLGEAPDATPENKKARDQAFASLLAELKKLQ
ncbi:dienelactone hydrolase family protein [Acidipila sp. EB88]|uniref:dienelactone hydrolase family protein n=1 Tax=Acidipila sp. EB88 TaxID=2305226 RepID=UPI000F5E0CF3|nr:dienelactone hydrolase family protein [Acidipila sp. EB88]RRA48453.1 dienelactone hydrolase family protein [Acidipila sp. EB88]